jgi:hypothetical protein
VSAYGKRFFWTSEETFSTTKKAATTKAKEVADSAKRHNDIRIAKKDLNDLYQQVGKMYFEESMDYPQAEYIDLFNLIEKLRGDIEVLQQEIDGEEEDDEEE